MERIIKYFPQLTPLERDHFSQLKSLYEYWNNKLNLISKNSLENFYLHHILHSLSIAKIIDFLPKAHIMDLGTGGGFPGLPLALLFSKTHFTLVDSINKKIKALRCIIKELNIENIELLSQRAETIEEKYDFIITRSVASFPLIYKWTHKKIKKESYHNLPNGIIALKGGDLHKELQAFPNTTEFHLKKYFEEAFFTTKKIIFLPL